MVYSGEITKKCTNEDGSCLSYTLNDAPIPGTCVIGNSFINLISNKKVEPTYFGIQDGDTFIQQIFATRVLLYDNQVNRSLENLGLKSSNRKKIGHTVGVLNEDVVEYEDTEMEYGNDDIIDYISTSSEESTSNEEVILVIEKQTVNNFLNTTVSGTKKFTEVYLNSDCSSSLRNVIGENEDNLDMKIRVLNLCLLDQYFVAFNAGSDPESTPDLGTIRVHYYGGNGDYLTIEAKSSSYEIEELTAIVGELKNNESKIIPITEEWNNEDDNKNHHIFNRIVEDDEVIVYLELPKKELVIENGITIDCYSMVNMTVTNDVNYFLYLIVSGELPNWIFEDILPLPVYVKKDGGRLRIKKTEPNEKYGRLYCINSAISEYGVSLEDNEGHDTTSKINLTNVAKLETFNRVYGVSDPDEGVNFYVNKVTVLERFRGQQLPFKYYDGLTENSLESGDYTYEKDWSLLLPPMEQPYVNINNLTVSFKIDARNNILSNLTELNDPDDNLSGNHIVLDLSQILTNPDSFNYLYYEFKNGIFFSYQRTGIYANFRIEIATYNGMQPEYTLIKYSDSNGFIKEKTIVSEIYNANTQANTYYTYCVIDNSYLINSNDMDDVGTQTKVVPKDSLFGEGTGKIKLEGISFTGSFSKVKLNRYFLTNCYSRKYFSTQEPDIDINLVIKGTIPDWLYEYLPLGENFRLKPDGEITRDENDPDWYKYPKVVSINAIPYPGLEIDNRDAENQCSMDLSQVLKEDEDEN